MRTNKFAKSILTAYQVANRGSETVKEARNLAKISNSIDRVVNGPIDTVRYPNYLVERAYVENSGNEQMMYNDRFFMKLFGEPVLKTSIEHRDMKSPLITHLIDL